MKYAAVLFLYVLTCSSSARGTETTLARKSSPEIPAIRFYQLYISDLRFGRCRFRPSCSQYALEAIECHGLLKGAVLAADRLIRCNRSARHIHRRDGDGRLLDPVDGEPAGTAPPILPAWLLPEPEQNPFSDGAHDRRIVEIASFAGALAEEGDCWRAATEYKRAAFISKRNDIAVWSSLKIGYCYYHRKEWDTAAAEFSEAGRRADTDEKKASAYFMAAASCFNAGRYRVCEEILELLEPGSLSLPESQCVTFLAGLCSLALGDWDEGASRFAEAAGNVSTPYCDRAAFLAERAAEGPCLPRRSPALAAVLSSVIPGSG